MAQLKTFLFTDICRSVDLKNEMIGRSITERDMAFIAKILTPHRERIEAHLAEHGGRVVSTAGDGHFLVFDNTIQAAQWAVDVQKNHHAEPIETPGGGQVEVRISVHVGVPQIDPGDPDNFVGKSVDYASRLNDYATGSQILISRSVMAILDDIGLEGISFHLHGRRPLKGIGQVEVHELMYDDHDPRPLRQRPQSNSDRQWTVVPTVGFEGSTARDDGGAGVSTLSTPLLTRIGNYQLEEVLGSGGMGDVYKGRHVQFNRVRAVKVIKPQFVTSGNKEIIRRFYQEIKAVGALEHKNIVVAIDSSSPEDRLHYLVMEFIDGVSLHDLVDQLGYLSTADACEIIRQAARGLQYIHRNGMVHRDIKPSNLMVTLVDSDGMTSDSSIVQDAEGVRGIVKILDLGLALLAEDKHERLTRYDNKAMGTSMYMSPEQWKTTSVDIRADIYSLGCTLYHMLAGNPPFFDSDLRPEKAHEKSRVPPIRTNVEIPRKLSDVIHKMLAKRPDERFGTPAEISAALTPFCEGCDLVNLVRSYTNPEDGGSAIRRTRVDSGAKVDTWLSRASHLYPTRRWLLRSGLPLLLVGGVFGGMLWSLSQTRKKAFEQAEQKARDNLPFIAKRAVDDHIGKEITKRFEILQEIATDAEMIALVQEFDVSQGRESASQHPLQDWIGNQKTKYSYANSDSWFINDRNGRQISRSPILEEVDGQVGVVNSLLKDYAYRNYFHGEDRDRDKTDTASVKPIEQPNLSAVYESTNSGKLKVAFSVPIRSAEIEGKPSEVVGVLSMSVDVGEFEILDGEYRSGKETVLVDLREDFSNSKALGGIDNLAGRGMILHHPQQSRWKDTKGRARINRTVLEAMLAARLGKGENFVSRYQDPFEPSLVYWGAFEGVAYRLAENPDPIDSGWVVLVQEAASF